jgi:hypothetical protein
MLTFSEEQQHYLSLLWFCLTTLSMYLRIHIYFSGQYAIITSTPKLHTVYHPDVSQARYQQAYPVRNISSIHN